MNEEKRNLVVEWKIRFNEIIKGRQAKPQERRKRMFDKELIVMSDRKFQNKKEVISYLAELKNGCVGDPAGYRKDVFARENAIATYVGFDTAIPHAKSAFVNEPFVLYARLPESIEWGDDGETVSQVFLLGVPKDANGENARLHLQIIAALTKRLMHESFRRTLNEAGTKEEIYQLFTNLEKEIML